MGCSGQIVFVSLILACLLSLAVAQQDPLYHFCLNDKGNYTTNSTYQANLNRLLSSFSSNTANDSGFYNISVGQDSDQVNAISLCRGDVSSDACLDCIINAATELRTRCPNQKEAIIWYDYCMLRYSNRSIFGVTESNPSFYMWNQNNVTDVNSFNSAISSLLDSLRSRAASGGSLRKFATGTSTAVAFQTIYALVQCTPDLSELQCSSCLSEAIGEIPQCCDGRQGGRVVRPSCNFRFETGPFYNSTADAPSPSPPPPSPPLSSPPSNDTVGAEGTTPALNFFKSTTIFFLH